ncbi:DUF2207 domain-containing protein [Leucobacter albus]|uniref:DUF2207 domain-containing protein n=1 Tax=Leucobacter albus TaxID=272210 RepID=A0ABW3TL15_9MICO
MGGLNPVGAARSLRRRAARALGLGLIAGVVAFGALFAPPGTVPLRAADPPPAAASVDDYYYSAWHVELSVSADAAGRSVARVTETITAQFPDSDVNRGIVRGIPIDYAGWSTDPRDFSVTDEAGRAVPFRVSDAQGARLVGIGDANYVHGEQTYVLGYTLSDVILPVDDGPGDELYWDLMGTDHGPRIDSFTAEVTFSPETATALDGNIACYSGLFLGGARCSFTGTGTPDAPITIAPMELSRDHGVTLAVGLTPGAFAQPPNRRPSFTLQALPLIVSGLAAAGGIAIPFVVRSERQRRRVARGTIVPQYDVPAHLPPLIAAPLIGRSAAPAGPAQIVHLAVNGVTRLEDGPSALQGGAPQPVIRVLDPNRVRDPLDHQALQTFVPGAAPGSAIVVPQRSTPFASGVAALERAGGAEAVHRGYLTKDRLRGSAWLGFSVLVLAVLGFVLGWVTFGVRGPGAPALAVLISAVAITPTFYAMKRHLVCTPSGAEVAEWLAGVELFIRVAEADRLRVLQSYSGAERRQVGELNVIELYEKLLPYAMLFKLEREWSEVLRVRYEANPQYSAPWYPELNHSRFGSLSSSMTRYTGALASASRFSTYSGGASFGSYSGSSGSSGGGYVGGGGGGGFTHGR